VYENERRPIPRLEYAHSQRGVGQLKAPARYVETTGVEQLSLGGFESLSHCVNL
jgi:hypothetical protein